MYKDFWQWTLTKNKDYNFLALVGLNKDGLYLYEVPSFVVGNRCGLFFNGGLKNIISKYLRLFEPIEYSMESYPQQTIDKSSKRCII